MAWLALVELGVRARIVEDQQDIGNAVRKHLMAGPEKSGASLYGGNNHMIPMMRSQVEQVQSPFTKGRHDGVSFVDHIINKFAVEIQDKPLRDPYGPAYQLVIAGACFMSLGCTLPPAFKQWLKQNYTQVGLMRDGLRQMKKALDDVAFQDGKAYDFGSTSHDAILNYPHKRARMSDRAFPNSRLINTPAPNDTASPATIASLPQDIQQNLANEALTHRTLASENKNVCAGCNASDKKVLLCGKCKIAKYCGSVCQRADFASHKQFCTMFAQTKKGSELFVGNRGYRPRFEPVPNSEFYVPA